MKQKQIYKNIHNVTPQISLTWSLSLSLSFQHVKECIIRCTLAADQR